MSAKDHATKIVSFGNCVSKNLKLKKQLKKKTQDGIKSLKPNKIGLLQRLEKYAILI